MTCESCDSLKKKLSEQQINKRHLERQLKATQEMRDKALADKAVNKTALTKGPWPKTWEHKESKKRVRVMPWWECLEPLAGDNQDFGAMELCKEIADGRKFRIGALVQVGWLLENEHGCWFGVGPKAEDSFTEIDPSHDKSCEPEKKST